MSILVKNVFVYRCTDRGYGSRHKKGYIILVWLSWLCYLLDKLLMFIIALHFFLTEFRLFLFTIRTPELYKTIRAHALGWIGQTLIAPFHQLFVFVSNPACSPDTMAITSVLLIVLAVETICGVFGPFWYHQAFINCIKDKQ